MLSGRYDGVDRDYFFSREMKKQKAAIAVGILLAVLVVGYTALERDIAVPPPRDERLHIEATERRMWEPDVANQIFSITVVARGRYALVSTSIDMDNIGILEKRGGRWIRVTPNGWSTNISRVQLMRVGVPFEVANALVNGMRYQWHRAGHIAEPPPDSRF